MLDLGYLGHWDLRWHYSKCHLRMATPHWLLQRVRSCALLRVLFVQPTDPSPLAALLCFAHPTDIDQLMLADCIVSKHHSGVTTMKNDIYKRHRPHYCVLNAYSFYEIYNKL